MGLWSWVGEASASRNRATEVAPTLAGKVECSFIYTKLDSISPARHGALFREVAVAANFSGDRCQNLLKYI